MKMQNQIKKVLIAAVCFVIAFSVTVGAFSDVDPNTAQGRAIAAMQEKGYINGFEDGTFRPNATLTRAEFVTIVNEMYRYYIEADNIFKDVRPNEWYYHAVLTAVQAGYIKGMGDGTFAPNSPVTREQVCVMLDSILKLDAAPYTPKITDEVSGWARESVEKLVGMYMFTLEAGGKFRATQPITRGEVCEALEKCILDIDFETVYQPINLENMAQEKLDSILTKIITCMEEVIIPSYTFEETVKVGNMVVESMKKYLEDNSYDYVNDANATYEVYRKFDGPRAREFKNAIYDNLDVEELAIIFDFFYRPEITEIK